MDIAKKIENAKRRLYELKATEKQLKKEESTLKAELTSLGLDVNDIPGAVATLEKNIKKNNAIIQNQLEELENEYPDR